jgi:hypothetical protein
MKNASSAGNVGGSDSIEAIALNILEKFEGEGIRITKSLLLESFLDAFFGWLASPDIERVIELPSEVALVFFTDRRNELRARFQVGIDAAYTTWEKASQVNGSTVAH